MKPKQVLHAVIQRLGKLGAPSASRSLCWELLLGTEQCQPGEWEAGNMKLSFRHFSCGYSQVLCSTVLLKFLQWALEISQSYFHSRIVVYCCSLWGEGDGMRGVLLRILVISPNITLSSLSCLHPIMGLSRSCCCQRRRFYPHFHSGERAQGLEAGRPVSESGLHYLQL